MAKGSLLHGRGLNNTPGSDAELDKSRLFEININA
jgi:hypothetical protein